MKLYIPGIREAISFEEDSVHTLVVENPVFLYELLKDINSQMNRFDGNAVLSINNTPVDMNKHAELITDLVKLDFEAKAFLGKINAALDAAAQGEERFQATQELLCNIEKYLYELAEDRKCNLNFEHISMLQLIKAAGVTLSDDYPSLTDRLFGYMEAVCEFVGERLFIILNMRNFVSDEAMQSFHDSVIKHSYRVLFIEATDRARLKGEERITIDKDLCEF